MVRPFTCVVIQSTCFYHWSILLDFQNYLRAQPGNTSTINLIISTVDYLLRLQESIMDFYWHYSSKEAIDEGGKQQFLKVIQVCSQVFNTLTEGIQVLLMLIFLVKRQGISSRSRALALETRWRWPIPVSGMPSMDSFSSSLT